MLRSTLAYTVAICFACTPSLFGQVQVTSGFPSRVQDALETNASAGSEIQIRQRPWLGTQTASPKKRGPRFPMKPQSNSAMENSAQSILANQELSLIHI